MKLYKAGFWAGLIVGITYGLIGLFGHAADATVAKGMAMAAGNFALAAYFRIGDE